MYENPHDPDKQHFSTCISRLQTQTNNKTVSWSVHFTPSFHNIQ